MSSINRRAWSHLLTIGKPLFTSEKRWRAFGGLALILALLLSLNGLNVVNSYVGRGFMSAIADREDQRYYSVRPPLRRGVRRVDGRGRLLPVHAGSAGAVVAAWLTQHLTDRYLSDLAYYRLTARDDIDNPDQRISEDVRSFTSTLLSFVLMLLNSTMTTHRLCRHLVVDYAVAAGGGGGVRGVRLRRNHPAGRPAGALRQSAAQKGGRLAFRPRPHPRTHRSDCPAARRTARKRPHPLAVAKRRGQLEASHCDQSQRRLFHVRASTI